VPEFLYHIPCPHCRHKLELLEDTLVTIFRNRRASTTGAPFLTFVCQECKGVFQFDYQNRATPELTPEGYLTSVIRLQRCVSVIAECDDSNHKSLVELISIRSAQTTAEQWLAERPQWNLKGVTCEGGHPLLVPPIKESP
jgi:hypothetical protein